MEMYAVAALLPAVICVVFYLAGSRRRPNFSQFEASDRAVPFQSAGASGFEAHTSCRHALDAITRWAESSGYRIEHVNEAERRIVFGCDMNVRAFHCGYWIVAECETSRSGGTLVNIDVRSKTIQANFILALYRDETLKRLRKVLRPDGAFAFS